MGAVKTGDKAKDFSLRDQNGKEIRLSDPRGRKVLLSFHPLAWISICAEQMKSLGIKNTSLPSDFWPHGKVAQLWHIQGEGRGLKTGYIIVDESGRVIFVKVYPPTQLPGIEKIVKVLERME